MTKKNWILILVALLLAAISVYLNKDWFAKADIQIYHRSRPVVGYFRRQANDDSKVNPVVFGFNQRLKLTSLRVVVADELLTNKYPHALWHLVSESNSVPIKDFVYGMQIRGMHPYDKGARPEPLEPDVPYRLLIEAGKFSGQHDFTATAKPQ